MEFPNDLWFGVHAMCEKHGHHLELEPGADPSFAAMHIVSSQDPRERGPLFIVRPAEEFHEQPMAEINGPFGAVYVSAIPRAVFAVLFTEP